ncbi:DNA repair protein RecO [Mycoplasmopsis gallinarum]|uniref:DNA repair protein RecO n=1 Tax=Mycoplasmopsis gallinarum TaxID=29557 RepID=UPI000489C1C2|nr:DNA repair protein RecO C-terminal domain-containing protein [Mycoplasmopsis gallinarum]
MAASLAKGIVLEVKQDLSNDTAGFVIFWTPKEIIRLYAPGIYKPNSKNRFNLLIGSYCEIEFFRARLTKSMSKLMRANSLININFEKIEQIKLFKELTKIIKNLNESRISLFNLYLEILQKINQFEISKYPYILTYFLAQYLPFIGLGTNYFNCSECNKNNQIVDFQFAKGGYLCINCAGNNRKILRHLKAYYHLALDLESYINFVDQDVNNFIYEELKDLLKNNGFYLS